MEFTKEEYEAQSILYHTYLYVDDMANRQRTDELSQAYRDANRIIRDLLTSLIQT